MSTSPVPLLVGVIVFLTATVATAAPISYNVNQIIGLGSVVGTIETNGSFGTLTQSDIVGFDLVVSGPGASVELTQADSVVRTTGSDFGASASNLFFDYSGASGYLLFQQSSFGTGMKYYCNASVFDTCFEGASAVPEAFNNASAQVEPRTGNQVIASAAGMVPEPASWTLMIGGFGMVGGCMRRRSTAIGVAP
ncbi:PEPxxWA-CTERM sorting domain-containing protein (plasmid) [Polymorphobacter sp. PAMC 29334]|uniref:PEPxxWA-CTERM sorting domain-containing protein n=1 Tax=Polymorphobacter sp. PAMC 29334 TaxID=2862331 RepID=UPI001C7832FA|nr:PEPxxWA-CTERM sorting domain-containing protein [Polymorphobacter sp. PAMC 29334]QYE33386.1 PEPxxWA-CTERM sorting domain-containing protein [Polymorphobacter sp. PAMC 29334]